MAAKFKRIFNQIWQENETLFQEFFVINNDYSDTGKREDLEEKFQQVGHKIKKLLVEGEQDLCRQIEKSTHRAYSSNLADKYWDEVRKYFKYIDLVGVKSKRV